MNIRRILILAICTGLTVAASSLGASVSGAASPPSDTGEPSACVTTSSGHEVCTTNPGERADGIDLSIVQKFREYVQSTQAGDTVRFAMYVWVLDAETPDSEGLAQDLIEAQTRGVDVKVVTVGSAANEPVISLLRDAGIEMAICNRNCLPDHEGNKVNIMHLKFLIIDRGDDVLVAHASSNLRINQYAANQNLLSISGDRALYSHYLGFWNRMFVGSWTFDGETWDEADRERAGDTPGTKAYFFPRSDKDPVYEELTRLSCRPGHNKIWVAATLFTDPGRLPILTTLDQLHAHGCDVRVLVTRPVDHEWVLANSDLPIGKVRLLPHNHNKLLITNALYDGVERSAVYAGSHNLNTGSLEMSSDGMLRVTDPEVYEIYARYFIQLSRQSESPGRG